MVSYVARAMAGLRRKAVEEDGAAGTEWVVATAIVVLFAVPVLALIGSGSNSSSQVVVKALEKPNEVTISASYAPIEDDADEGEGDDETEVAGNSTTESSVPGLDMGVGYDITEEQSRIGYSESAPQYGGMQVRSRNSSATSGSGSAQRRQSANSSSSDVRMGGHSINMPDASPVETTPENRPLMVISVARRDKQPVQNAKTQEVRVAADNVVASGPRRTSDASQEQHAEKCKQELRPKFLEREPTFAQGGGLDEALFDTGDIPLSPQQNGLFDDGELRILDENSADPAKTDCVEERALVTAAGEQLGDGTVLGMVTISASSDGAPVRRAAPLNPLGMTGLPVPGGAKSTERKTENVNDVVAALDKTTEAAVAPEMPLEVAFDVQSAAGFAGLAELTAEVSYTAAKAPAVRQSGR
ncbi:hypothetical protein [Halovulum sp. GXIMD14793]